MNPGAIRADGDTGPNGHSTLHVYQSQSSFGIATSTPTDRGVLKTRIEGDFFGSDGGEFRLRHAYGEWNGLLAGQTKTNFGSDRFIGYTPNCGLQWSGRPGTAGASRTTALQPWGLRRRFGRSQRFHWRYNPASGYISNKATLIIKRNG
ncbi:hypothetical protein [Vreelandella maris]|uniref:Porin n=1 Tax=Vreelandella maris TaxID=2729617 RepID=A0A7Y6RGZ8_9GAMM|nr:hypothetical protein [Halomonas maris]NVF16419.1 hypothetical protein [Halomonas maris]